ncbi:MAG: hypothetical protein JWM77_322 [Rhodospirillales bacterium]|nr:hypothetical protein [Rhodospirillales bacterium]
MPATGIWLTDGSTLNAFDPLTNTKTTVGTTGVAGLVDIAVGGDGKLFAISDTTLYRLDETTGSATRIGDLGVLHATALAAAPNGALLLATADSGTLYRVDATTGSATSYAASASHAPSGAAGGLVDLIALNGELVGLRADGTLAAYELENGKFIGTLTTEAVHASGLAVGADGHLYAFGNGQAWAIDVNDGSIGPAIALSSNITGAASAHEAAAMPWLGTSGTDAIGGSPFADLVFAGAGDDTISTGPGHDVIVGGAGNDAIDGGSGIDEARFSGPYADYKIEVGRNGVRVTDQVGSDGVDTIKNVEILRFEDKTVFVLGPGDSTIARLYAAAFGRAPDENGLRVQLDALHDGVNAHDLASNFLQSAEFLSRYGTTTDDATYVQLLYRNVLGRDGEDSGFRVQVDALAHGIGRDQLLLNFADSAENQAHVQGDWLLG